MTPRCTPRNGGGAQADPRKRVLLPVVALQCDDCRAAWPRNWLYSLESGTVVTESPNVPTLSLSILLLTFSSGCARILPQQ